MWFTWKLAGRARAAGGGAKNGRDDAERTEEEEEKGRRMMGRHTGGTGASACLWLNERPSWTDFVKQSKFKMADFLLGPFAGLCLARAKRRG